MKQTEIDPASSLTDIFGVMNESSITAHKYPQSLSKSAYDELLLIVLVIMAYH